MTKSSSASDAKSKEVAPFLKNLRKMLDQESDEILRWTADGRAFEIHDMARMMDYVLPKYFKHRKYTSFQRQLNYFNFKKWTKSKAAVCTFSNDYFVRDEPELSWRITRKKSVPALPASTKSALAASRKASSVVATAPQSAAPRAFDPTTAWKAKQQQQQDMAIVVPRTKSEPRYDSFPSPTDMDMMLLESETDVQRYYNSVAMHAHGEDSLDWIDNFLPSLEVPSKIEDPYYYHSSMTIPSILRPTHYAPPSYHSLPPPSSFGCVSAVL